MPPRRNPTDFEHAYALENDCMNETTIATVEECVGLTLEGRMPFPQVVQRLLDAGIERYSVDLCRSEYIYYLPDGDSHVVRPHEAAEPVAERFSAEDVESAVRDSQQGRIAYPQFLQRIRAAGCVGYLVSFAGRRCLYLGRTGESHLELFPGAA
jgi:uncharacterized protein YbcV (DUF1398 family)